MGTRHLIAVVVDDEFKIAQYGQWDGYPSGQGAAIIQFLGEPQSSDPQKVDRADRLEALRTGARKLRWATDEDFARINTELNLPEGGWMDMEQAERYKAAYPAMSRDAGGDILAMVADGGVEFVTDSRDFALDSLFCEWAYVLDLDANTLEVYKGFQKERHDKGRWAGLPDDEAIAQKAADAKAKHEAGEITEDQLAYWSATEYHSIALAATFDLATVSDEDMAALEEDE